MEQRKKCKALVTSQTRLTADIFSMWLQFPEEQNAAAAAVPGQFISMYSADGSRLLPRPISICDMDCEGRWLRVVYRLAGQGTEEFSKLRPGSIIEVIAPLGNGFDRREGKSILIGGGIGIPPMLALAKSLPGEVSVVLGYRDKELFLSDEFYPYAKVYIATEDGSVGTKGNVIDAILNNALSADQIYACGPVPMLRGVKLYAREHRIPAQISMEEKMACGIGACLACVCESRAKDAHSNVHNKRVCKDGPVFAAEEIEI
ncbi:MAG: dihydroorotate dehydrogenase electron transfer subunit [Clostridiaceae bacterium]|nr:dihydroorotate dehydrogenase electron transfer subunit [Clostridiaceae bacterium]